VGCSHATRLALAVEDLGQEVKVLSAAGWTANPDVVVTIGRLIREERELNEDVYLVYFLFDNEIYKVDNGGELTDNIKLPGSNVYHVNGSLKTVKRDKFKEEFINFKVICPNTAVGCDGSD
jgi:hypothetical protein